MLFHPQWQPGVNLDTDRLDLCLLERHELAEVSAFSWAIWMQSYVPGVLTREEAVYFWERSYCRAAMARDFDAGARYYWLVIGGERVGFCSIHMDSPKALARLGKLYLRPESQGQGLAREVLEALKNQCKSEGCLRLWLYVFRKNERAIRAYRKAGLEVVDFEISDAGGGFFYDDAVMSCDLTSGPLEIS